MMPLMFKLLTGLCFVIFAKIARRKQLPPVFMQQTGYCLSKELIIFLWLCLRKALIG